MTPQEFEAKNIGNFNSYHELMEAYAEYKCKEQAEAMYTSEEVKEVLIRYKSDMLSLDATRIKDINPYRWFKDFEKEEVSEVRGTFTEDQMYLFAGFCQGQRMVNPFKDVAEIMQEWKETFKTIV